MHFKLLLHGVPSLWIRVSFSQWCNFGRETIQILHESTILSVSRNVSFCRSLIKLSFSCFWVWHWVRFSASTFRVTDGIVRSVNLLDFPLLLSLGSMACGSLFALAFKLCLANLRPSAIAVTQFTVFLLFACSGIYCCFAVLLLFRFIGAHSAKRWMLNCFRSLWVSSLLVDSTRGS